MEARIGRTRPMCIGSSRSLGGEGAITSMSHRRRGRPSGPSSSPPPEDLGHIPGRWPTGDFERKFARSCWHAWSSASRLRRRSIDQNLPQDRPRWATAEARWRLKAGRLGGGSARRSRPGKRLSFDDGLPLEASTDLLALGRDGQPRPRELLQRELRAWQRQYLHQPDECLRLGARLLRLPRRPG